MSPATITLLFLLFAIVMFVWEKIPLGVTSMIICVGLVVTGVLDFKTAFAGFIDSNVILFVAMFIVGGALFETGMANKIGGIVTHFAKTERQLIIAIMVIVGLMSGVLSNTGTAAVLIPVVIGIAARSGYSRSRLLMPLVFAAAMGGNLSLIGAPGNLIAQSVMEEMDMSFSFFEYAKVGLPILICGIIYFAFIGYKFLPDKSGEKDSSYDEQKDFSNVPKWKQALSLIILVLTLIIQLPTCNVSFILYNVTVQPFISYIHKPASELSVAALQLMFTHFRNERLFYHKKVLNNTMNKLIVLLSIFLWLNCYYYLATF